MKLLRICVPVVIATVMIAAILAAPLAQTQQQYILCAPGVVDTVRVSDEISIFLSGRELKGRFVWPESDDGEFEPNSLPAILLGHGFNGDYTNMSGRAAELAQMCYVSLVFNWRGHGPNEDDLRFFTFYDDEARADLEDVTLRLMTHLSPTLDLVDDDNLGMMGRSQGSLITLLATADEALRGLFRAMAPYDGIQWAADYALPNDCLGASLGQHFDPQAVRTPQPSGGGLNDPGVAWATPIYADLSNAYLTNPPLLAEWEEALAERNFLDELANGYGGLDYPHVYLSTSWYDAGQHSDYMITAYDILTPTTSAGNYPFHRIFISVDGHNDDPWNGTAAMRTYQRLSRLGWFRHYMPPDYVNPPTATPGDPLPPTATPYPVEAVVDSFDPDAAPPLVPTFELVGDTSWPPDHITQMLYLESDGRLSNTPPGAGEGFDTIGQDYAGGYSISAAVAENPHYISWTTYLTPTTRIYTSSVLAQDVILVQPPQVQLWVSPTLSGPTSYQVHVRLREELASGEQPFITRANACAWNVSQSPPHLAGTPFEGVTRAHRFHEGSRIVVELSTIDQEEYWQSAQRLSIVPYLAEYDVHVWREQGRASNITLHVVPDDTGAPIFLSGGRAGEPGHQPQVAGTPPPPPPLEIAALVLPEQTNPGGWHAWRPEVWFDCWGGEGAITCPDDQFLVEDGLDQRFTYTATDAVGHVATTTVVVNIDQTAPTIVTELPAAQSFCSGATLPMAFSASDALSGLEGIQATFNGLSVAAGQEAPLVAGANLLHVDAQDVAGNWALADATVQVDYDTSLDFPPDGQTLNPLLPLSFAFKVNDLCAASGWYNGASADLWLISPSGEEQPAEWYGIATGSGFALNSLTGWYEFDADLSGLAAGTWTARADLDDGTNRSVTFVIPAAGPNGQDAVTLPTFDCAADLARNGRYLGGCR